MRRNFEITSTGEHAKIKELFVKNLRRTIRSHGERNIKYDVCENFALRENFIQHLAISYSPCFALFSFLRGSQFIVEFQAVLFRHI